MPLHRHACTPQPAESNTAHTTGEVRTASTILWRSVAAQEGRNPRRGAVASHAAAAPVVIVHRGGRSPWW